MWNDNKKRKLITSRVERFIFCYTFATYVSRVGLPGHLHVCWSDAAVKVFDCFLHRAIGIQTNIIIVSPREIQININIKFYGKLLTLQNIILYLFYEEIETKNWKKTKIFFSETFISHIYTCVCIFNVFF